MGNSITLYGSIGCIFLRTTTIEYPKYIFILSDNHSKLPYCKNYIMISKWLKNKSNINNILLEEVPRNNVILTELFSQSEHTQKLKDLFIQNPKLIKGIDIRPLLIKFSWELLSLYNNNNHVKKMGNITLNSYLENVNTFFNFTNKNIMELNENYNENNINQSYYGIQFKIIKNLYIEYKSKYNIYINYRLINIYNYFIHILEEFNFILDNIMEFYTIMCIFKINNNGKNVIIHTGLLHAEKIVFWLEKAYLYETMYKKGITDIETAENNPIQHGCLHLSKILDDALSRNNT